MTKKMILLALVLVAGSASAQIGALNELKALAPSGTDTVVPATPSSEPLAENQARSNIQLDTTLIDELVGAYRADSGSCNDSPSFSYQGVFIEKRIIAGAGTYLTLGLVRNDSTEHFVGFNLDFLGQPTGGGTFLHQKKWEQVGESYVQYDRVALFGDEWHAILSIGKAQNEKVALGMMIGNRWVSCTLHRN